MFEPFLKNRVIIDLYLKPVTPLHIGAQSELFIKTIIRVKVNNKYTFIIPSESIKGSLRNLATIIARNMNFSSNEIMSIVQNHKKDKHENYKPQNKNINEILENIFTKEQIAELSEKDKNEYYASLKCPICNLFGSRNISAKLKFFDAHPIMDEKIVTLSYKTFTSTSIDRDSGIAKEGALHTTEFIEPSEKIRFKLKIILNNIEQGSDTANLLANLLQYILEEGIIIGGLKSKGFGLLKIDEEKSSAELLNLTTEPKTTEEIKNNILKLAQKEGIEKYALRGFIKWLKTKK
ncbi:MAG: RAMP superfamily CRISPR-associated protein [Thermoprotei archaeon]|jgi:CRISPR-associated RAMP protein (TIGR02581 family)